MCSGSKGGIKFPVLPGTSLPCRNDDQVLWIVAVNGTDRLPDALAPLIYVRRGAEGDKQTPNVTKCHCSKGTVARSPMPYPMVHLVVHRVL